MIHPCRVSLLLGMTLLVGCSTTTYNTLSTIKQAALGDSDVVVSMSQVENLPYASAYIRVGDNPQAFVVLAFADKNGNLSWMSADHTLFITHAGRIIKTVGLENDLMLLSSASRDPLKSTHIDHPVSWRFQAEWAKDYVSGYTLLSQIKTVKEVTLPILDKKYDTWLLEESIELEHSGEGWQNRYWVDSQTGAILKSEQQLGPHLPVIEMTILKPYSS